MKVTKRITMSVLTLVLTVIALGTITFAWFSLSTVSNVSNISGSVRGGEGLEVRLITNDLTLLDDDNKPIATQWKSNLNKDDVEAFIIALTAAKRAAIEDNAEIFTFNAVSTIDEGANFRKMTQEGEKTVVNGAPAVSNIDYLEFNIEFRSATEGTVRLDEYAMTGNGTQNFVPEVAYKQINGTDSEYEIVVDPSNGARFSLTNEDEKTVAYQNGEVVYDEENDVVTIGNTANDKPQEIGQYSYLVTSKQISLYYMEDGVAEPKLISLDGLPAGTQKLEEIEFLEAKTAVNDKEDEDDEEFEYYSVAELDVDATNGYLAEFTIRIWIEGWDADTYDSLFKGRLILSLIFVKVPITVEP